MISSLSDPFRRQVQAADVPLDQLASSTQVDNKTKVVEACRQFEAIFVRQILAQAENNGQKKDVAKGIYQDMVTNQTADNISRSGGLGLAHCFQNQLTAHGSKASSSTPAKPGDGEPAAAPNPDLTRGGRTAK